MPPKESQILARLDEQYPNGQAAGERTISVDEMTGVQALERAHPDLPLRPGHVERREYEYIGHGTLSFIINFDVPTVTSGSNGWTPIDCAG